MRCNNSQYEHLRAIELLDFRKHVAEFSTQSENQIAPILLHYYFQSSGIIKSDLNM